MKTLVFVCLIIGFSEASWAQNILGSWQGSASTRDEYGNGASGCDQLSLDLSKNSRGELLVHLNYDCIWSLDWSFSHQLSLPLDKEGNILGEDGYLKDDDFFFNNVIAYKSGSKIQLKMNEDGSAIFTAHETDEYHRDYFVSGTLNKISAPISDQQLLGDEKLNGDWKGTAYRVEKDSQGNIVESFECPVNKWSIPFQRSVWTQNHLYLPDCKEDINEWFGPFFLEYGKVFVYPAKETGQLYQVVPQGTYDQTEIQVRNPEGYGGSEFTLEFLDAERIRVRKVKKYYDMTIWPFQDRHYEITLELKKLN